MYGSNVESIPPYCCVLWTSDYDAATATSWTMAISDNGDSTLTADITAYY